MKVTIDEEMVADREKPIAYSPRTALGKKLLAVRERVIAEGAALLSWEEVEKEVAARRGGYDNNGL